MARKNARPAAKKARAKLKAQMAGGKPADQPEKRRAPAMGFSRPASSMFEMRIVADHMIKRGW